MQVVAHRNRMNEIMKQSAARMALMYGSSLGATSPQQARESDREAFAQGEITLEEYETREEARLRGDA